MGVALARAEVGLTNGQREGMLRNSGLLVLRERCEQECKCKSELARRATQWEGILDGQLR